MVLHTLRKMQASGGGRMKSVLISIRPQWVEKITSGEKTIEVRKTAPQEVPFKCYIYETQGRTETPWIDEDGHFIYKGRGQVIGEFICDKVERLEEHIEQGGLYYILSDTFNEQAQLDNWELHDYGKGKTLYGWHISDLKIYDKPKELSEFNAVCRYINEDKSCHFRKVMCPYQQFDYNEDGSINIVECSRVITRPPQSWCYVEDLGEEE